uniref:Sarcosine oxidase n=1 Tax=Cordyceps militaris TaxID=73501 RepID=J3S6Y3_CORMI|nr:sarcosine oxidase [Cordyceps militaris]
MANNGSYIIIGAGVFGVSTALHLIKKYPNASVTLVDRDAFDADSRVAASWDWNKVVRADYDDIIYCQLALEAQDVFNSDPLWQPHFHETGIFWMARDDYANEVIRNYQTLGRKADLSTVSVSEARKMHGGLFQNADYSGVKNVLVNKTSGWVAAGDCLRSVTRAAMALGVRYVVAEVATLTLGENGECTGVITKAGESLTASHTIVCAGAYTPKLLDFSANETGVAELRAGHRIVAGGITTGMTTLNDSDFARHEKMPVGSPVRAGSWTSIASAGMSLTPGLRSAWPTNTTTRDAFTTSSDFIISPHAAAKGLYLATCGSFHGYKFFPVLGKYVVQMLEGDLSAELQAKWAWDRQRPDPARNPDWPRVEMKNYLDNTLTAKL